MKRIGLTVLAVFLLLCFSGCGAESKTEFEDVFCLTVCDGILCKLNTNDGTLTALCNDPLCGHTADDGCPLSGYVSGTVWKGCLYFTACGESSSGNVTELRAYDFSSSKVRVVCRLPETPGSGGGLSCFRNGYYCCGWTGRDSTEYEVHYTVNLKTRKYKEYENDEEIIADTASAHNKKKQISIRFEEKQLDAEIRYGDEVVLYSGELAIAFTEQLPDGKLLYGVCRRDGDGRIHTEEMSLYMLDPDTGDNRMICESFKGSSYTLVGNDMFYVRHVDDPPVLGFDKNNKCDAVNPFGGVIWRLNTGTGEEERFLSIPEYRFSGVEIRKAGDRFLIGYRNTDYSEWTEEIDAKGSVWYEYPETNGWIIVDPADRAWIDAPAVFDGEPCKNADLIR